MARRSDLLEKQKTSCRRKRKYKSADKAMKAAIEWQETRRFSPATYQCMVCGSFHIASIYVSKQKHMVAYYYGA